MNSRFTLMAIALLALLALYNLPPIFGKFAEDFWTVPFWGFMPASIVYFVVWLLLAVPVAWLLMRFTWRDAA